MDHNDRRLDALCASTRTLTAALAARDAHTQEHADRVIGLAIRLARAFTSGATPGGLALPSGDAAPDPLFAVRGPRVGG